MCGNIWCKYSNEQKNDSVEDPAQASTMLKMTFSLRNAIPQGDVSSY